MPGPQTVWGIDVGKSAFKALKMRLTGDGVEVVGSDYIEHAKIMSQQDADPDALWSAALEKFLAKNDITNDKIVIGISGQQTLARFSKLPPVENKKKIPDIVTYEAKQQIPFDPDEVVWDYQVFETEGSPDVEVGIFAIKRELIRDHLVHFDAQGIEAIAVQAAPLAAYNALLHDGLMGDKAVVIIDIGTESTDLIVGTESSLWTRSIQLGGNNFTEALVKAFKLSFSKAETLKRTAATSKYARQIFQAMRPVFADLIQELQRSIGYYTATHRGVDMGKVYGMGNAFKLPGLQKYIKQNLQLDLSRIDSFSKISIPDKEGASGESSNYSIAYGLALQGLGQASVSSNLLPPEIALAAVWKKKRPFFAAAAACVLLAAGVVWFRGSADKKTLATNAGTASVSVSDKNAWNIIVNPTQDLPPRQYGKLISAAAKSLQSKYRELNSQGQAEIDKAKEIQKLLANRTIWLKILSAVHESLPKPAEAIAKAQNAAEYLSAISKPGLDRESRGEIFIESFTSRYVADVDDVTVKGEYGHAGTKTFKKEGNNPRAGFIIELIGYTTHAKKGIYVDKTFVENLQTKGRVPKQGFFINRVGLMLPNEKARSGGGRGRGRGGRSGRNKPKEQKGPQKKDPLTGEISADDYHFRLVFDVVLADLPEPKEERKDGN
ncbi:MAG: type IV pilus assembly protein PilM [Planctomycetes bacterium]|nr:type IV pilus assembly protein PilM [Planctomycetota bacterium]